MASDLEADPGAGAGWANRFGQAITLDSLGYTNHQLGEPARAIQLYESAAILYRQADDRVHQGRTLIHLGGACDAVGDTTAARNAWQLGLRLLSELSHPEAIQACARQRELEGRPGRPFMTTAQAVIPIARVGSHRPAAG